MRDWRLKEVSCLVDMDIRGMGLIASGKMDDISVVVGSCKKSQP